VATAEVVRDFPLSLKGGAAKAKIVSATRRKQTRETPAHRRASCALPHGFGGAAGFAASPGFGGAPPADAGPPGESSSGTASMSCSVND